MFYAQIAKEVLDIESKALQDAQKRIADNIDKAVELIYNIKGKLIVTGVGKSGLVGSKIAATFASTGTPSFFIHPTEALHGDLGMIGKEDGVLAISYSGESEELIKILPHIKRFDIPLIGMSSNPDSSLGRYSDVFISIAVEKEACPLQAAPTASTTLTMALGDALAVCLMKKRNFQVKDFASFHPGGSLGRRLYVKVKDLMRTENLPIIDEKTPLKEAIVVMSEGKLGNVLIKNGEGKLVGVLSDGDLRRALMSDHFSLETPAFEFATKNPKAIEDENMLASDALRLIEQHKIQMLAVTKNGTVQGVLHIHDLVEAGIK
ncbi:MULTISPECIES: SIS domain-containing protein [unclassified Nitratiruptor]|uniref:KpsF/GutQ family sugar-phosphate isomerase n=1 Tax=unclassified Nitratiruptor TaxID=2624044 RepID=UPI0019158482|nr:MULTISPECIES: KpsF/GutQ family sugar-phosphate isomerase [unclassified Nitratiruptor]BCD59327.1 arabinose-5-phosphate isomerase [Nitratiruptor sp. YY08-10]BCD63251.1 arabinose-5-phosphate isomerase [Nitratiruptor sp. YY08-14]